MNVVLSYCLISFEESVSNRVAKDTVTVMPTSKFESTGVDENKGGHSSVSECLLNLKEIW
mgnify:CR=1 FL=1